MIPRPPVAAALRPLVFACVWIAAAGGAFGQKVLSVGVQKMADYQQTSATDLVTTRYYRRAGATLPPSGGSIPFGTTARLLGPGGTVIRLTPWFPYGWTAEDTFASEAELDAATPDGTYTLDVSGTTQSFTGSFAYAVQPLRPSRIANFDALQAFPGPDLVVQMDAVAGGTAKDYLSLQVSRQVGDIPVTADSVTTSGTVTSFTFRWFDGLAIRMGKPYTGQLTYGSGSGTTGFNLSFPLMTTGPVVYTYAGRTTSYGNTDGPRETAGLYTTAGLASDSQGNLYCTNFDRIRKVATDGTVSTYLYQPTPPGSPTLVSEFYQLAGVAIDAAGTLYVVDGGHQQIKKISPAGVVSLLAGSGNTGSADGAGPVASFWYPVGIAVAGDGNVYVADSDNATIRKITPGGLVSTFAGRAGATGTADGVGSAARFQFPSAIGIDRAGNLYVGDGALRRIAPDGTVTTLPLLDKTGQPFAVRVSNLAVDSAGNVYFASDARIWKRNPSGIVSFVAGTGSNNNSAGDGMGNNAEIGAGAFAIDPADRLYFADRGAIRMVAFAPSAATPAIKDVTGIPISLTVGRSGLFHVNPGCTGVTGYQWQKDGKIIAGATTATLLISNVATSDSGNYTVSVLTASGMAESPSLPARIATYFAVEQGRLSNLSVRTFAGTGDQTLIVGFAISGPASGTQSLLVRGIGPALAGFGVTDFVADPTLTVFRDSAAVASNDDWNGDLAVSTAAARVGAFPLLDIHSRDAALQMSAAVPASYSVQVSGKAGGGTALAEIYAAPDASTLSLTSPRMANVSARAMVGGANGSLTAGFVIGGSTAEAVLIRAIGPGLRPFGVTGFLAEPKLELYRSSTLVASNGGWSGDSQLAALSTLVGAFPLSDPSSKDAVLALTLDPGGYTAVVRGDSGSGVALIEVYEVR